jgi:exodeoxyribonuclease VII small subunit
MAKSKKQMSFEEALKRLENIVEKLEDSSTPLEEAIRLFEEGRKLSAYCQNRLTEIEKKVKVLIEDKSGGVRLEDFEPEESEESETDDESSERGASPEEESHKDELPF